MLWGLGVALFTASLFEIAAYMALQSGKCFDFLISKASSTKCPDVLLLMMSVDKSVNIFKQCYARDSFFKAVEKKFHMCTYNSEFNQVFELVFFKCSQ